MSHTLRSGLQSGRIDDPEHGEIVIEGGEVEVEDYETAAALVDEHGLLFWSGGDPGAPDAEAEADDSDDSDAGGDGDGGDDFDIDAFLERDYEARAAAVEAGEVDAHLDAIKEAERSSTVEDAVDARQADLEG